jgi:hypothetical protein
MKTKNATATSEGWNYVHTRIVAHHQQRNTDREGDTERERGERGEREGVRREGRERFVLVSSLSCLWHVITPQMDQVALD